MAKRFDAFQDRPKAKFLPPRNAAGLPSNQRAATKRRPGGIGGTRHELGSMASRLEVEGVPSLQLMEDADTGGVIIEWNMNTKWMAWVRDADLAPIRQLCIEMQRAMVALSHGPLTLKMLAALGHPYGRDKAGPRKVPGATATGKSLRHIKQVDSLPHKGGHIGVKGSVPTLTVINIQSGHLAESWSQRLKKTAKGVVAYIKNSAPYAWYLAHGTDKMQAHGPFTYVPTMFRARMANAWRQVSRIAGQRALQADLARIAG